MKKENRMRLQITPKLAGKILLGMLICTIAFMAGFFEINWGAVALVSTIGALFLTIIISFSTTIIYLIDRKWMALFISWLIFITSTAITILVGVFSHGTLALFYSRLWVTLRNGRSVIFLALFAFLFGQILMGLVWKRARKWGLLAFTILIITAMAIVGQVIDYTTRRDIAYHAYDAIGRSFK